MSTLESFCPHLTTADTKKKLSVGQQILDYLEDPSNTIDVDDIGSFIDAIVQWMNSSNFKVSQNGLDIIGHLIDRMGSSLRPYLSTILSPAVDRLGDTREIVREKSTTVIMKLMEEIMDPTQLFEKITGAFTHKNGKVREEILRLISTTLNSYGASSLTISKFMNSIIGLLSDPTAPVRDMAMTTLVEIYRHVGERVRLDLQRKYTVPPARLSTLMIKFDEMRDTGNMMPTATLAIGTIADGSRGDDETDRQSIKSNSSGKSRSSSVPAFRRALGSFTMPKPPPSDGGRSSIRRTPSVRTANSGCQAGAIDEDSFIHAFEDVKKVTIFSNRELNEELNKIRETLTKTSNDWKIRIDSLQCMRALILGGAANFDDLIPNLKTLEVAFQLSVKDLRSQVVREACISIAFMCVQLKHKADRFCESLLQNIINLIPNSAKVMSTSGIVCVRFIIQNTYSSRFIPIITANLFGKSRDIRKHCTEFLDHLLHAWPTQPLEKHVINISDAIKRGITDADPDVRSFARKAYWGFADHFKDQADVLLNSLDGTYRRLLQAGEMSNSSSSNSLNTAGKTTTTTTTIPRSRQSSITSSQENLMERKISIRKLSSGIPMYTSPSKMESSPSSLMTRSSSYLGSPSRSSPYNSSTRSKILSSLNNCESPTITPPARSNSAIDPSAARRANIRAQYAQRNRMGIASGASLPRPRKKSDKGVYLPENGRTERSRSRMGIHSHSQPGSRSTSPTALKSYHTYLDSPNVVSPRHRSGIPRSTGTSREASPSRFSTMPSSAKYRSGKATGISLAASVEQRPPKRPLLTEDILKQSREAESVLAFSWASSQGQELASLKNSSPRKRSLGGGHSAFDDGSDESETSSLCSEKSYDYSRRHIEDINEIIANCASTHWADRKDGLVGLQNYFRDGRMLSATELRRITDIFTRMFMDAHTKVFSLFLDTLTELIVTHKDDLQDWVYVLLTKLFLKQGSDLLGSIIHKINRTLDIVRETFSYMLQFSVIVRFLVDQTQVPNSKVKIATMNHLHSLAPKLETCIELTSYDVEMALAKIITWTYEPKSGEVRKSSQEALIALFTYNGPFFTSVLYTLPQVYQSNAAEFIQNYLTSTPMKSRTQAPNARTTPSYKSKSIIDPVDDSENLNPEEVIKSLRSTANAIQNYSFGSGIKDNLEDRFFDLSLNSSKNGSNSVIDDSLNGSLSYEQTGLIIKDIITELQTVKTQSRSAERRASMTQLIRISREGPCPILQENFRSILRLLLDNLMDEVGSTRALVFGVLTEMLRQESLVSSFQGFIELIILKVLEAHRDIEKDVERAAENCAATMAGVLPTDLVIRVLNPIIKTGDFPMNLAAIKMLTKVSEHEKNKEVLTSHLEEIMPGLLKAYDNIESSVRKAAVFCMVALHQVSGDLLAPYLEGLNGSKLKLLNLYIKRAQSFSELSS